MITVSVNKLKFKKNLSMIEQYTIKDILFQWVGPTEGLDDFLPLDTQKMYLQRWKQNRKQPSLLMGMNISDMRQ